MPAPKKTTTPGKLEDRLVPLTYKGEAERRYEDPATGLTYLFPPRGETLVPLTLARRLVESDEPTYALLEA